MRRAVAGNRFLFRLTETPYVEAMPSSDIGPAVAVFREILPGSSEYGAAVALRHAVLRAPLGLEFTHAEIADEPKCFHLAAIAGGEVIGTLLLKPLDAQAVKMRQVAVHPDLQCRGIGARLVRFAEAFAREKGCARVVAHARGTALTFYERLGYTAEGAPFLEKTIPHQLVMKRLD